jgi:rhodanese-related sulfurtransferase
MQQYLSFMTNHWTLVTIAGLLVLLFLANEAYSAIKGFKKMTPQQVTQLINRDEAQLIDVRDKNDFTQGHIITAINMPFSQLSEKLQALDKNKLTIIICTLGQRAQKAAILLKEQGFANIAILEGGLTAWRGANFPVVKK